MFIHDFGYLVGYARKAGDEYVRLVCTERERSRPRVTKLQELSEDIFRNLSIVVLY